MISLLNKFNWLATFLMIYCMFRSIVYFETWHAVIFGIVGLVNLECLEAFRFKSPNSR